eukprot:Lithocolla_globosa_v1_NODE_237_length_4940_cov_56.687001.p4 type:complete len:146 gc:universal NODE_237_length_4940_cov_56.687001:4424-3987(-)
MPPWMAQILESETATNSKEGHLQTIDGYDEGRLVESVTILKEPETSCSLGEDKAAGNTITYKAQTGLCLVVCGYACWYTPARSGNNLRQISLPSLLPASLHFLSYFKNMRRAGLRSMNFFRNSSKDGGKSAIFVVPNEAPSTRSI